MVIPISIVVMKVLVLEMIKFQIGISDMLRSNKFKKGYIGTLSCFISLSKCSIGFMQIILRLFTTFVESCLWYHALHWALLPPIETMKTYSYDPCIHMERNFRIHNMLLKRIYIDHANSNLTLEDPPYMFFCIARVDNELMEL